MANKIRTSKPSVSAVWPEILHLSYSAAHAVESVSLSFVVPCSLSPCKTTIVNVYRLHHKQNNLLNLLINLCKTFANKVSLSVNINYKLTLWAFIQALW